MRKDLKDIMHNKPEMRQLTRVVFLALQFRILLLEDFVNYLIFIRYLYY